MLKYYRRRFIVLSEGRSGSTYLATLLDSHPNIVCKGELLHPNNVGVMNAEQYLVTFQKVLDGLWKSDERCEACGCKIKNSQIACLNKSVVKYLVDKDVQVIHIVRRNVLNLLIEQNLVRRNHLYVMKPYPPDSVVITVDNLYNAIDSQKNYIEKVNKLLPRNILVEYEDLCWDKDCEIRRIAEFLGVEFSDTSSPMVKQMLMSQSECLVNYQELQQQFKDTEYSWFFE